MAKKPPKKATVKDVAREAGVSISTVSNALNNVDVLHPDTKRRVLEAAKKLNYIPNINGQRLKAHSSGVIGLFVNAIRGPYYSFLSDAIYGSCHSSGYELEIFISDNTDRLMNNLLGGRVDGAVILNEHIHEEQEKRLAENEVPVVFLDRAICEEHISSVVFDSYHGGELVGEYLLGLGHRKMMYISGIEHNYDNLERRRGFEDVLKKAGIKLSPSDILKGEFEEKAAYQSVSAFVKSGKKLPDAIFAANDLSAIGAIKALTERGIRVPEDVSVIGCDDIETAALYTPSLSTVCTTFEKQGVLAVQELTGLIGGNEGSLTKLSGRIIARASTAEKKKS